jgi:hypothetical protein
MEAKNSDFKSSRRKFLTRHLPVGAVMCLGCRSLLSAPVALMDQQQALKKAKYLLDSGMTVEDVFKYTYNYCVPLFQNMGEKLGKEKLLSLLTEASAENGTRLVKSMTKGVKGDMKAWAGFAKNWLSSPPYDKAISFEITEESDKVFETKYTECLAAKLFREMNAADIGYAIECSSSDKVVKAFNPQMEAKTVKNMMKGDAFCVERITLKT